MAPLCAKYVMAMLTSKYFDNVPPALYQLIHETHGHQGWINACPSGRHYQTAQRTSQNGRSTLEIRNQSTTQVAT